MQMAVVKIGEVRRPFSLPFSSLRCDDCLVDRSKDYQNCSVVYCVLKQCTVISILR